MKNTTAVSTIVFCAWLAILPGGYATAAPDAEDLGKAKTTILALEARCPQGNHDNITVPDTLDLSKRAAISLNALDGILQPQMNYEFLWELHFDQRPMTGKPDARSFSVCGPKVLESFPMMMVMCGNNEHNRALNGLKNLLISWIADDGIQYCKVGADRPWDKVCPEDWACTSGQARMMLAMLALYQMDKNPAWLTLIKNMSDGLIRATIDKGDYAYYPANTGNDQVKMGESYCFTKSGYYDTQEAVSEHEGAEGSMFCYIGTVIRGLTRWYRFSGDQKAIEMAGKLVNYVMRDKYWGSEYCWPKTADKFASKDHMVHLGKVIGAEHGQFVGHFHGHTLLLYALIEYANAVNDNRLKEFVRSSYEYARCQGIARIGLFGEPCTISDMLAVAIKLSEGGVGDYWDDVDGYVRNQLIEQQLTDADKMAKIGPESDKGVSAADLDFIKRSVGVYSGCSLGQNPIGYSIQCCTANATQGLYYAWEGILRNGPQNHVQVNLLLNRVSPWIDVYSCLPYEGKVVLTNKTARSLSLRIPSWADRNKTVCLKNDTPVESTWAGNYILLNDLRASDRIVVTFPIREETVTYTVLAGQQWTDDTRPEYTNPPDSCFKYTCQFKGNTLVDFSPRPQNPWYPTYARDKYKADRAPMKSVPAFVTSNLITW